jgi:hypothetical protein
MTATMGVKVRFWKGAWDLFIDHHGRRRAKKIGDRQTAQDVARAVREKLARGDLGVFNAGQADTVEVYATRWLEAGEGGRKASTQRFYTFNLTHTSIRSSARAPSSLSHAPIAGTS